MRDEDGVHFLQSCLPRLGLRWRGYRRVRRLVFRRLEDRLHQLGLPDLAAYRAHLDGAPEEWAVLEALCRVPISRFYRDRAVFEFIETAVLPELAGLAAGRGEAEVRGWSIGCAAGEEPYTLAVIWAIRMAPRFPGLRLSIVATDADPELLAQAGRACYPPHSVRDLPPDLRSRAFRPTPGGLLLEPAFRAGVEFREQDVRRTMPDGPFHLALCRNVVCTYLEDGLQRSILARILDRLLPGGALILGSTESLPSGIAGVEPWAPRLRVYRRAAPPTPADGTEAGHHAERHRQSGTGLAPQQGEDVAMAMEAFQATLAGLRELTVQVEPVNADAEGDGLTRADLQADVETALRGAGMNVVTASRLFAESPGAPVLHLDVMTVRVDGPYAYSVRLELWQAVRLVRAPGLRTLAVTWCGSQLVGTIAPERLAELRRAVGLAIDEFVQDWRVADAALAVGAVGQPGAERLRASTHGAGRAPPPRRGPP